MAADMPPGLFLLQGCLLVAFACSLPSAICLQWGHVSIFCLLHFTPLPLIGTYSLLSFAALLVLLFPLFCFTFAIELHHCN